MIKSLKQKEGICFSFPEHPKLYQWNSERITPQNEIQKDRFNKYFHPVLRRLLLENKSDETYIPKLNKLTESRLKLRKYSVALESARLTIKKKLGSRTTSLVNYVCEVVLDDMINLKRSQSGGNSEAFLEENRRRYSAELAYYRLTKVKEEFLKDQEHINKHPNRYSPFFPNNVSGASTSSPSSPLKSFLPNSLNSPNKQHHINSLNLSPVKGMSITSNGVKRDVIISAGKDFFVLEKYLKDRKSIESTIHSTLKRVSEQFPVDWKYLLRTGKEFVKGEEIAVEGNEKGQREKKREKILKWVTNIVRTYNTLRILLKQIYSEGNAQKQRNFCLEFERTTMKLFDLLGIGLLQEAQDQSSSVDISVSKSSNGLIDSLEGIDGTIAGARALLEYSEFKNEDLNRAREENLIKLGSSYDPVSNKEIQETLAIAAALAVKTEEEGRTVAEEQSNQRNHSPAVPNDESSSSNKPEDLKPNDDNIEIKANLKQKNIKLIVPTVDEREVEDDKSSFRKYSHPPPYFKCRRSDGRLVPEFSTNVNLMDAVSLVGSVPIEEPTEVGCSLNGLDLNSDSAANTLNSSDISG